ncbi:MAG TPA: MopE-related protein, partial [Myxococcota bacterium]|nr:MopE-related protein [Myxococcota bacterium]
MSSLLLLFLACPAPSPSKDSVAPNEESPDSEVLAAPVDADKDGYTVGDGDCDDTEATVHPLAGELCNGRDDNCNVQVDEGQPDADRDGVADCMEQEACDGLDNNGDGKVDEGLPDADLDGTADCMDVESCDGRDNTGEGQVDEGFDADGDGYTSCNGDCDDGDAAISPLAAEFSDTWDNNCDGAIDENEWSEGDLWITELMINPAVASDDGGEWLELYNPTGRSLILNGLVIEAAGRHILTSDRLIYLEPGAYVVLGDSERVDENGDSPVDHTLPGLLLANEGGDIRLSYGSILVDRQSWGQTASGASYSVDGSRLEQHADVSSWCAAPSAWGEDTDRGSPGTANGLCASWDHDGDGFSGDQGDCDDADPNLNPSMTEQWYDGVDQDCDGHSDFDADGDGFDSSPWGGSDCADDDAAISPVAAELCEDSYVDEDCDGLVNSDDPDLSNGTALYPDADGDGYGDRSASAVLCNGATNLVGNNSDCDDTNALVSPAATEVLYDGVDGDCAGDSDYDGDGDGFDGVDAGGEDCDDSDPAIFPYAWEVMTDTIDNDCDGGIDQADTSVVQALGQADDSSVQVSFDAAFSFPFCGSNYSSMYFSSNGILTASSYTSYSESYGTLQNVAMIAGLWDDLYPSNNQWASVAEADHTSFYWRGVTELSAGNSNTFALTLLADGRVFVQYEGVDAGDGLVGISCGGGAAAAMSDVSTLLTTQPGAAAGLGNGVDALFYEVFGGNNDL